MNILIKSAKIIDPNSKYHNKTRDILIKNGTIKKIRKNIIEDKTKIYKEKNLHISPGWFDLHVNFGEPGHEERETFKTGIDAAINGGFTGVMIMPNTNPKIDNKNMIEYINNQSKSSIIDLFAAGNITKAGKQDQIVEMHDMKNAGCLAFTNDKQSINNNEVLKIAMLYSKDCNTVIMNFPNDHSLSKHGQVNEGDISTLLGLKGIPKLAETIMLDRDISMCEYTNSKLHLSYISTQESVNKLKRAKSNKLNITADVPLHNLFLTEDKIHNFDTRYKVMPPLRTLKDNEALIKGLKDNIIDVISTDHTPQNEENKKSEFDKSEFGIIGLETAFGLIGKYILPKIELSQIIEKIAINPRKILNTPQVVIEEEEYANLTCFNPKLKWKLQEKDIRSKSKNTPFIGEELIGKALAIYNKNKFIECKLSKK